MNNEYKSLTEFYPTPPELIAKMLSGIDVRSIKSVLEPSAGKGDICHFIDTAFDYAGNYYAIKSIDPEHKMTMEDVLSVLYSKDVVEKINREKEDNDYHDNYNSIHKNIDCIEIDNTLQAVLKGRDYSVVDDNFLTFDSDKHYDLIIMNPPFSNGDEHLLHAITLAEKTGGRIVCLLNAETIKNPYSQRRQRLLCDLQKYNAETEFVPNAFNSAERQTGVEVCIVKIDIPSPFSNRSRIWEELEEEKIDFNIKDETCTELVIDDSIKQAVMWYKREIAAGKKLIEEYLALKPYITSSFEKSDTPEYAKGSNLYLVTDLKNKELDYNQYVYNVRYKYWYELLHKPTFMENLTSNLKNEYFDNIREYAKKDFSLSNIYKVKLDILKRTAKGIEDKIVSMFEKLSYEHSMGCENNVHYFNGWKSNSAFKINEKVVVPYIDTYSKIFNRYRYDYHLAEFLIDIEKCLDFLDGGENKTDININYWLEHYERVQQSKKLQFKYFEIDVFKKGTIHIRFTDLDALKRLNIYGCMHKGWLPPSYGKKAYSDMDNEEKRVVDEYEGEKSYVEVFANKDRFIVAPENNVLLLEGDN